MTPNQLQMQAMLDEQARLSNEGKKETAEYQAVIRFIKDNRFHPAPLCWGDDDCSTHILSMCPWRIDCYEGDRE